MRTEWVDCQSPTDFEVWTKADNQFGDEIPGKASPAHRREYWPKSTMSMRRRNGMIRRSAASMPALSTSFPGAPRKLSYHAT